MIRWLLSLFHRPQREGLAHPERLRHVPLEDRTPEHYVNRGMVDWLRRIEGARRA